MLILLVVRFTQAIIEGRVLTHDQKSERKGLQFWNLDYLRTGATEAPFLTLIFFFTVFLGVSYLFGLALAFHDKARPPSNPALYMHNLNPLQSSPTPIPTPGTPSTVVFRFTEGFASVPMPRAIEPNYSTITDRNERVTSKREWLQRSQSNDATLNSMIDEIAEKTKTHARLRVVVVGYSDIARLSGQIYQSNYELAEARAQNVKQLIEEKLSEKPNDLNWRNIEWTCLSLSNELPGSEKRVEVKLEPSSEDSSSLLLKGQRPNSLNLLDYVYFANYTITTTGYGDIVPTTPYAKFICSFANIVEVFFLVVFFNVLLSVRRVENHQEQPHLSDKEFIERITEGIKQNGIDNVLIEQNVKKVLEEKAAQNDTLIEQSVKKLFKKSDAENRRRLRKVETTIENKVNREDIEETVKQSLKNMSMAQILWGKIKGR